MLLVLRAFKKVVCQHAFEPLTVLNRISTSPREIVFVYLVLFLSRAWALMLRFVACNLFSQPQSLCGPQKSGRKPLLNFVAIKIPDPIQDLRHRWLKNVELCPGYIVGHIVGGETVAMDIICSGYCVSAIPWLCYFQPDSQKQQES